ncbi:MAG TPA: c-type cytochrome [Methylomirabilota bacterium]|nr:c-type cytochrome [Methylomirabilota bacterium]
MLKISLLLTAAYLIAQGLSSILPAADYRSLPLLGNRSAVWIAAELHLMFAAFVLGVPIFAFITEIVGAVTRERHHDELAREFTKLLAMAYTLTAALGAILLVLLLVLYPKLSAYMSRLFKPTWLLYVALIFAEVVAAYLYWYTWDALQGPRKRWHLLLGAVVNLLGTALLFIADIWVTFMMSPAGVDEAGNLVSLWAAIRNFTWMPINIHRLLANVAFGGAIVAAYAAVRFLAATNTDDRARFDWMGYVGSFIAIAAFIPLPFAGYWLGREIYQFSEQMGVSMMGGGFSWLWILQAMLIGSLFLAANVYLWLGMGRIPGAERYVKFQVPMMLVLTVGFIVWATPRSIIATGTEMAAMGGSHHPFLGLFGVMAAKNTAVNLMILTTFVSFMLYRRGNRIPAVRWAVAGKIAQAAVVAGAAAVVLGYGVYSYYVPSNIRIGFSVYQVLAVLGAMAVFVAIDIPMLSGAREIGAVRWGHIPARAQYALFFLAISFTWLMGLMGYIRSGIRQYWHVYGRLPDQSGHAYTPTHGHATLMVSMIVLVFFAMVAVVFGMAMRDEPRRHGSRPERPTGGTQPTLLKIAAFALAIVGIYAYVGQLVPQFEEHPPAKQVITARMTPDELAAAGQELLRGKGGCLVCHKDSERGNERGPDLRQAAARAATRKPGMAAEAYLIESLVTPDAFLVPGYPKMMPPAIKPPASLSMAEVKAVVAYLQALGGGEVTVRVSPEDVVLTKTAGPAHRGREVMAERGCLGCHKVQGEGGTVGPDLTRAAATREPRELLRKIVDPTTWTTPGYPPGIMPATFGATIPEGDLHEIVGYLASLSGKAYSATGAASPWSHEGVRLGIVILVFNLGMLLALAVAARFAGSANPSGGHAA